MNKPKIDCLKPAWSFDGIKVIFYAMCISVFANSIYTFHLLDMIEAGKGNLIGKLIEFLPSSAWTSLSVITVSAMLIAIYQSVRATVSRCFTQLWVALILLSVLTGIIEILMSDNGVYTTVDIVGIVCGCVLLLTGIILGRKISQSYTGKLGNMGKIFMFMPAAFLALLIIFMIFLPDTYGQPVEKTREFGNWVRIEQSYSPKDIAYTVIMVVCDALSVIIPVASGFILIEAGSKKDWNDMDDVGNEDPEHEIAANADSDKSEIRDSEVVVPMKENDISELSDSKADGKDEIKIPKVKPVVRKWIIVGGCLALLISCFFIFRGMGNQHPDYMEENSDKLNAGIRGEAICADGRTMTFKTDGTIPELSLDARWEIIDNVVVIFTGEGTAYWSIIDGYIYVGRYEDGQCWNEEWVGDGDSGGLDVVGYTPEPSKGEKLREFHWYVGENGDTGSSYNEAADATHTPVKPVGIGNGGSIPLEMKGHGPYTPDKMIDGNFSTTWAVNLDENGYTAGKYLYGPNIQLNARCVSSIKIVNGYAKSKKLWEKNCRAKWIMIYRPIAPDSGDPEDSQILYKGPLKDTMEPQILPVNPAYDQSEGTDWVTLAFSSSPDGYYWGSKAGDLCISEIEFME